MAGIRYSLRFAVMGIAAALCSMTFSVTAPAYFDSGGTATNTASPFDNVIVISLADVQSPAFDIMPLLKQQDRVGSDHPPAFRPKAIKERASRSAVRPTAVSGWRSGRIRTLAA
jgi:hypothetical protein